MPSGALGFEVDGQTCEIASGGAFALSATSLIRFRCLGEVGTVALKVAAQANRRGRRLGLPIRSRDAGPGRLGP